MKPCEAWGVMWRSRSKPDGLIEFLMWRNRAPVLFATRRTAQAWIAQEYGYIAKRRHLRVQPFGWTMPRAVRVEVILSKGVKAK